MVSVGQWGDLVRSLGRRLRHRDHDRVVRRGRPARLRAGHRRPRRLLGRRPGRASTAPATTTGRRTPSRPSTRTRPCVSAADGRRALPSRAPTRTSGTTPRRCRRWRPAVSRGAGRRSPAPTPRTTSREQAAAWAAELTPYEEAIARACAPWPPGAPTPRPRPSSTGWRRRSGSPTRLPTGYRRASSNDSDPAPGDLTAFEAALADGCVDVLVYNTQTSGSVPEQLRGAAERAGVPVVEVTESPTDAGRFLRRVAGRPAHGALRRRSADP